ncbi:MAG: type sorting protein [Ignavibacteria bacterium]|nr:type sorting protein [Ignavibacteria bacterium]
MSIILYPNETFRKLGNFRKVFQFSNYSILIILFLLFNLDAKSQQKGMYDDNVTFGGGQRMLSMYVPTDYDSTKKYKLMVCLHGAGDASSNYRNALFSSLRWQTFITNTIFVCPDGGSNPNIDPSRDFYTPAGDEGIINLAIYYITTRYNIDTNEIFLQGFSLGGRSALKYGLDHPKSFKGLLLNTPAIQGIADANADPRLGFKLNFANAKQIPIAITHGDQDIGYFNSIDTMYMRLIQNEGRVRFTRIAGMQHSIPGQGTITDLVDFLNRPYRNKLDAEVTNVANPIRIYTTTYTPQFRLRNTGADTITSAQFTYYINKTPATSSWSGSITPYSNVMVTLPAVNCTEGFNVVKVNLTNINNTAVNPALSKKLDTAQFQLITKSLTTPYTSSFESNDKTLSLWDLVPSGHYQTWMLDNSSKIEGNTSLTMFNWALVFYNQGYSEDILSPVFDISTLTEPRLAFFVAFNYHIFTSGYTFSDTLKVSITLDSGKTYTEIYKKSGIELATKTPPISNPSSFDACIFTTKVADWRQEIIPLDSFATSKNAVFKFSYVSGLGGNIYLDYLRVAPNYIVNVKDEVQAGELAISPNPANDLFNIKIPEYAQKLIIYSLEGMPVYSRNIDNSGSEISVNTGNFAAGVYIVEIVSQGRIIKDKVVIIK